MMNINRVCLLVGLLTGVSGPAAALEPAELPAAVFAKLDGYQAMRISPDGERLAFLYPVDARLHLVVHTISTGNNQVVPPLEALDFLWLQWANDETLVFAMSLSAKRRFEGGGVIPGMIETEETRLVGLNVASGEVVPLIKPAEVVGRFGSRVAKEYYGEPQIQDNVVSWLENDPDHILVSLDEDFDGRAEVRKVNVNNGDYSSYRKSIDGIQEWVADLSGNVRLGYGYRLRKPHVMFKNAEDQWESLKDVSWYQQGWRPRGFTKDPKLILATGYGESGRREVRIINTETGEFTETLFADPVYDVIATMYYPPSNARVGAMTGDPMSSVHYFDEDFASLQASINKALPAYRNEILDVSDDFSKVVIHSSNSREAGALFIWDRQQKSLEPFGWFNEDLDSELLADVVEVSYPSGDGTQVPAYLTLPLGKDPDSLPAVVLPHGGPTSRDDKSYWFLSQFLVSRGYAVLQPNFRGSTGYGFAHQQAGLGQWGGIMQQDVDAGARWLIREGVADPERVCIVGWSYGAYSAAIGLVQSPDLYRCGAGINGVYNLPQYIADANEYIGGTAWTRHIGRDGESVRSVSPYHRASDIDAPFLIIHAEDDHRVRVSQADAFHERLLGRDKSARLVKVEYGGHSMVSAESRERILLELETFLRENIGMTGPSVDAGSQ